MVKLLLRAGAFRLLRTLRTAASLSRGVAADIKPKRGSRASQAVTGSRGRQRLHTLAAGAMQQESPASGRAGSHPLLLAQLAIPPEPGFRYLGARVEHVLAPRDGLLSELVNEALELPEVRSARLHMLWCLSA